MTPLLVQRPRADRAFERLYQRHVHAVYRYALAVLHNEADAEDVTQTTFLSAYRAFTRGERPQRPHNWLIKIAHNVCRQRFRDSSRRPQEVAFDEGLVGSAAPSDDDVPTAADIRRAIGFLAFNQRAALVMRELEGRSYAEIAQILDVSVGAVETLIFRARRALREQLEGGLTCREAEVTLSRLSEERLSKPERGALRAHLRECKECAVLERRSRSQRAALKNLGAVPLPASLGSFFGGGGAVGGGAALGTGIGAKIVILIGAGALAGGIGHVAFKAVAAKDEPASPALPQLGPQTRYFSPLAAITGGKANPIEAISVTIPQQRSSKTRPPEDPGASAVTPPTGPGHHAGVVRNTVGSLIPQTPVEVPRVQLPPPVQPPQVHLPVEPPTLPPVPPLPPLPPPPPLPPLPPPPPLP